ncbi:polysaccharide deacetylase family protein [Desulfoplanes sp. PS50]
MIPSTHNIPILCYHDIGTPGGHPLAHFCDHLDAILEMGFQTISAHTLVQICKGEARPKGKQIVITFDDAHVSNWLYGVPELSKRDMCGVFFPVTDFIWDGPVRTLENAPVLSRASQSFQQALGDKAYSQFMTRQELSSAVHDFGMEIYSHTTCHQGCFKNLQFLAPVSDGHWSAHGIYDHPQGELPTFEYGSAYAFNGFWPDNQEGNNLTFRRRTDRERYDFCLKDFTTSLDVIREINKADTQLICWPWGHFDKLTVQAAREAGYEGAFSLDRFRNGLGTDPMYLHRIGVGRKKNASWLKNRLRMHTTALGATIFYKFFRKKNEKKTATPVVWNPNTTR